MRVFRYIETLDAFVVTAEFAAICDRLGLSEWHPAVWVGRLFLQDNDYGEHWFDNWDEREALEARARELGIDSHNLMVVRADRFADGVDGPCNSPPVRKAFWTEVLKSLEVSDDLLFAKARQDNDRGKEHGWDHYLPDLEEKIARIQAEHREAEKEEKERRHRGVDEMTAEAQRLGVDE